MTFPIARRALLGLSLSTLTSCASSNSKPKKPDSPSTRPPYRGPLVRPEEIPGDFLWQQRVSARHLDQEGAFNAVLQKQGRELLVLGLTPFGTRAFSLTQTGKKFKYKQYVPFELPFSPEAVLIDIHRTFFFGLELGALPSSGQRASTWEGESMTDTFHGGHLIKRRFDNVSGVEKSILIAYSGRGYLPFEPSEKVVINNQAYGYTLTVETESTQPL